MTFADAQRTGQPPQQGSAVPEPGTSGALSDAPAPAAAARRQWLAGIVASQTPGAPRDTTLRRRDAVPTLLLLTAFTVLVALAAFTMFTRLQGEPVLLGLLATLAVIGIFGVFAASAGLLHFGLDRPAGRLESLMMRSPDGVIVLGSDGQLLGANSAFKALTGQGGLSGHAAIAALVSADPDGDRAMFRLNHAAKLGRDAEEVVHLPPAATGPDNLHGGGACRISVRALESRDGVDRAQEWRITPLTNQTARPPQSPGQDGLIRAWIEDLPFGAFIATPAGRIVDINRTLGTWTGLSANAIDVAQTTLADLIGEASAHAALERPGAEAGTDATAAPVATPVSVELRGPGGDVAARQLVMAASSAPAGTDNGPDSARREGYRVGLVFDVPANPEASGTTLAVQPAATPVVPALAAATLSDNLFASAPIAIAMISADGSVNTANWAFTRMIAGSEHAGESGKPVGKPNLLACVDGEAREQLARTIEQAAAGRGGLAPIDVVIGAEDQRMGRLYISPVTDTAKPQDGAHADAAIVYAIDTTKQRELEAQFAQGQKMQAVGQLAGGMAHDFNNLLTIITLSSDFLLSSHQKSDPAFQDIMSIKQVAGRAAGIVKQLLAFSRQQTLQPETLSITDEISDWSTSLRPLLGERIQLKTHHGRDLWLVKADQTQLGQVIMNLAMNAHDAMGEGGTLKLSTRNLHLEAAETHDDAEVIPGDYVLLEVSDDGSGMPAAVREKIFEPFFSTKEVGKGTGLGLSMVYGIIKQTGGYIFCDSTPDEGTTFRIYLPRHVGEIEQPQAARPDASGAAGNSNAKEPLADHTGSANVLLVEDEEPVRRLAARALERQGFEVLQAGSGVEALEMLDAYDGQIDLVVSDIVMPEMDGPALLKELRARRADMKIIFISGYAEDALKSLNDNEEFSFLAKPFQLADLVKTVKQTLDA